MSRKCSNNAGIGAGLLAGAGLACLRRCELAPAVTARDIAIEVSSQAAALMGLTERRHEVPFAALELALATAACMAAIAHAHMYLTLAQLAKAGLPRVGCHHTLLRHHCGEGCEQALVAAALSLALWSISAPGRGGDAIPGVAMASK